MSAAANAVRTIIAERDALLTRAETAEAQLAAIRAERDGEWQDISTAPKDGTLVDLWAKREITGKWFRYTDCSWGQTHWGTHPIGNKKWLGLDDQFSAVTPTHWRPLPAPPRSLTAKSVDHHA